jgi:transcriptional regulator with XRE-family HTH domain
MKKIAKEKIEEIVRLNKKGNNDLKISKILGISQPTVRKYRNKLGIKKIKRYNKHKVYLTYSQKNRCRVDLGKRKYLYDLGWTDKRISEFLGIDITTVRRWRKSKKLKPNQTLYNREYLEEDYNILIATFWGEKESDPYIASLLGVSRGTIFKFRKRFGVPPIKELLKDENKSYRCRIIQDLKQDPESIFHSIKTDCG